MTNKQLEIRDIDDYANAQTEIRDVMMKYSFNYNDMMGVLEIAKILITKEIHEKLDGEE